jgi:hypothetical protein
MTTTPNNPEATAAQVKQKMSAGVNPEQAVTETLGTSAQAGGTSGQYQSSAQTGRQSASNAAQEGQQSATNAAAAGRQAATNAAQQGMQSATNAAAAGRQATARTARAGSDVAQDAADAFTTDDL